MCLIRIEKGDIVDIFSNKVSEEATRNLREAEQRFGKHITDEIASSGSQKKSPNQITDEIREEAVKLAESPKGLDIAAFQKKHNIYVMNVDELLKG